jgi:MFS family permease
VTVPGVGASAPARLTTRGIPNDPNLRVLAISTFVNRAGTGAVATTFALFFSRGVGLPATTIGLVLSAAAALGLVAQFPLGHLGDVRGPRELLRSLTVSSGVVSLGLVVARSTWSLLLVMCVAQLLVAGSGSVRNGYIARIATGGQGVSFKAYLRAVTNVAMSFGAALGGLALWVDRTWAYLGVFALDGASTIAAGLLVSRLPHLEPAPARQDGQPRLAVLRDPPFVLLTLLTGLVAMHFVVMEVGIPLWISQRTDAPTSLVAVLLIVNTVVVSLFQVRLSRGADDVTSSARSMLIGCAWIAAGFGIISLSAGVGRWVAVVVLLAGAGVHVVGEMVSSAGQWGLTMGLAPTERQGQYQGFAGMGFSLSSVVAPSLIAWLCIAWGWPGWLVLGALVLGSGLALVPVSRWALRTRERYGALTASG